MRRVARPRIDATLRQKHINGAKNANCCGVTPINQHASLCGKNEIQKWNEKEGLPFGAIMQSLRLALVGNLSGPDLFDICEVLGNEITLRRLEKFINH